MSDRKRILDNLIREAQTIGVVEVREACNAFLKLKMLSTEEVKRQAVPRAWTEKLWHKQKGICAGCKDKQPVILGDATFDHIVPISRGGEHSIKNGRMVHKSCNSSKGSNDLITESKRTRQFIDEMYPSLEE